MIPERNPGEPKTAYNGDHKAREIQQRPRFIYDRAAEIAKTIAWEKLFTLLDLCVSSLRRGHANLLCIVPILTDDPRRESEGGKTAFTRNGRGREIKQRPRLYTTVRQFQPFKR